MRLLLLALFWAQTVPPPSNPTDLQAGSAYRQAVVRTGEGFDQSIRLFEKAVSQNPQSAAAHINLALAYVDKIPKAVFFSQISMGNKALAELTAALRLQPSWIAYYARAEVALYWPRSFGKWRQSLADLQAARRLQASDTQPAYYVRTYIAMGDAHWRGGELPEAMSEWKQGLTRFPENEELKRRLQQPPDRRDAYLNNELDKSHRANTDLSVLQE